MVGFRSAQNNVINSPPQVQSKKSSLLCNCHFADVKMILIGMSLLFKQLIRSGQIGDAFGKLRELYPQILQVIFLLTDIVKRHVNPIATSFTSP